jgi:hypothetical protein
MKVRIYDPVYEKMEKIKQLLAPKRNITKNFLTDMLKAIPRQLKVYPSDFECIYTSMTDKKERERGVATSEVPYNTLLRHKVSKFLECQKDEYTIKLLKTKFSFLHNTIESFYKLDHQKKETTIKLHIQEPKEVHIQELKEEYKVNNYGQSIVQILNNEQEPILFFKRKSLEEMLETVKYNDSLELDKYWSDSKLSTKNIEKIFASLLDYEVTQKMKNDFNRVYSVIPEYTRTNFWSDISIPKDSNIKDLRVLVDIYFIIKEIGSSKLNSAGTRYIPKYTLERRKSIIEKIKNHINKNPCYQLNMEIIDRGKTIARIDREELQKK